MRFVGTCYRGHDPRWSFAPLSGEGARARGGRFNPIGVAALYVALTMEGVMSEMAHSFPRRLEPLTICSYEVDVDDVVDLRTDANRNAAAVSLDELGCAWELDLANNAEPASWRIAEGFIAHGTAGILVPSFARGARADMYNLVLWAWGPDLPHRVNVYDPSGRLPKNQLSWD